MPSPDLSLVPSEDLRKALAVRYHAGVFLAQSTRDARTGAVVYTFWGDRFTVIGLLRTAALNLEASTAQSMGDLGPEFTEDPEG